MIKDEVQVEEGSMVQGERIQGRTKAEIVWGGPLTEDDILKMLNVVRLWASGQVPKEGYPWLWKNYMVLAHATEPIIGALNDSSTT